jgi:DNA replication and repair protein RecF
VAQCLGISRERSGRVQIRIDGQNARSGATGRNPALQLINPDSFRLLEGAPKIRRQFLDWGVFHVEPRFCHLAAPAEGAAAAELMAAAWYT